MATNNHVQVDPFSLTTLRLTMFRDDLKLSVGTGFLWQHDQGLCIATAWHCLTGAHYQTRQSIGKNGARPNRVVATFLTNDPRISYNLSIDLRGTDDRPIWIVHPHGSKEIDLAVISVPLDLPDVISLPINSQRSSDIAINVGSELFILGYPLGIARLGLPIWKKASLAIEPQAVFDDVDHRFAIVDAATREGLSGSPVIARREGMVLTESGNVSLGSGLSTRLYGVYTGRLSTSDPLGAQLGIVWPIKYIEEIVADGVIEDFD